MNHMRQEPSEVRRSGRGFGWFLFYILSALLILSSQSSCATSASLIERANWNMRPTYALCLRAWLFLTIGKGDACNAFTLVTRHETMTKTVNSEDTFGWSVNGHKTLHYAKRCLGVASATKSRMRWNKKKGNKLRYYVPPQCPWNMKDWILCGKTGGYA